MNVLLDRVAAVILLLVIVAAIDVVLTVCYYVPTLGLSFVAIAAVWWAVRRLLDVEVSRHDV